MFQPAFDVVGFKVPQSEDELRAEVALLRKQWIRNHFNRANRVGTATAEQRPLFIELSKISHQLYRCALIGYPPSRLWGIFWAYHMMNFAELADSPDLPYYYSFICTLKRLEPRTNRTKHF